MRRLSLLLLTFVLLTTLSMSQPTVAAGALQQTAPWVTDKEISALALSGDTVYLGGTFTTIAPITGPLAMLDATTGQRDASFPQVRGAVGAAAPDGLGGWFIAGQDLSFDGVSFHALAHIRPDHSADPSWNPPLSGRVSALALSGQTLYIGGDFNITQNGFPVSLKLAAVDTVTGELLPWRPTVDGPVYALAVGGNMLYVGGDFSVSSTVARNNAAAFDTATGQLLPWDPNVHGSTPLEIPIRELLIVGSTIYLGGFFDQVGGISRTSLAAVDATSGTVLPWAPTLGGVRPEFRGVRTFVRRGETLFISGTFMYVNGTLRGALAALDLQTGALLPWQAELPVEAFAMMVADDTLYVGGSFTSPTRNYLAALDVSTGALTAWNPQLNGTVTTLDYQNGHVFVGGGFSSVETQRRTALAATNKTTGAVLPWAPQLEGPNPSVSAMAAGQGRLYVAGPFTAVDGQPRNRVAAFDTATGALLPWNPLTDGVILNMVAHGPRLYLQGHFQNVADQSGVHSRVHVAAFDLATGELLPWNAAVVGRVSGLAASGNSVYLGGSFTSAGGQPRLNIAALDADSGLATAWAPAMNGEIWQLTANEHSVYIYGGFTSVGGQSRRRLAAITTSTGAPTVWAPPTSGSVSSLVAYENVVYVGGPFTDFGGAYRNSLAAVDGVTGDATAWAPAVTTRYNPVAIKLLARDGNTLYVVRSGDTRVTLIDTRLGAITGDATAITFSSATLAAHVSVANDTAELSFELTTTPGYYGEPLRVPIDPATLEGTTNVFVTAAVSGLQAETTYYYRVVVAGSEVVLAGDERSFQTPSGMRILLPIVSAP